MKLGRILAPLCLTGAVAAHAQGLPTNDPAALLQRITEAARNLNYAGTFVYANLESSITSRITHIHDNGDEWEKLESVDGPRQEIIRRNDDMFCYQPDTKTMRVDTRMTGKFFPSVIIGTPAQVLSNYNVRVGKIERIGNHECQWVALEPKDTLRFLQKLCAEIGSGLVLRAKTFNERNQVVERYSFTDLNIGKRAMRDVGLGHIKSRLQQKSEGWQTIESAQSSIKREATGWWVQSPPAGFKMVAEVTRILPGKAQPVSHLVFSDGIASVSVFIEPLSAQVTGFSRAEENGMVSFAMRSVSNHQVTVLGEVPVDAARALANGVSARARAPSN